MEKRLSYDVVIVGAGPSGASLGYFLAKEGVNVLLLEKERLPRYKSCAGGVPAYLDKLLGFAIDEVIEQKINEVVFTYRSKDRVALKGDKDILYTVMRSNFDSLLKEKAEEAGAEVLTGERAIDIEINDDGAEVITDGHRFKGKIVVGADGLSSIVARKAGLQRVRRLLITVQGEVWVDEETLEDFQGRVILDIGYVPLGACWVFPKKEHLTVGVAGLRLRNPQFYFDTFL
ncbi:geranylgeranyl reductase family protein, partial [Candidatus Woesearchaeota archaeon]|nr:geranylgeranyl reductase family protein [Candidatus Woesearchaeota archaeon]